MTDETTDRDPVPGIAAETAVVARDEYLRLAADFDNFKKRTRRDAGHQAAAEKEAFLLELLPVLDNLERALSSGTPDASGPLLAGVEMTRRQLRQLLLRHGVEPMEPMGLPFDPHLQEAVAVAHDSHQPDQAVLLVMQPGYTRGGKLFRPAKVTVNQRRHSSGKGHGR